MFGSTIVMKAAKKGYKRYGFPGAVVAGVGAFLGIRFVKQRFLSGSDDDSGIDVTTDSQTTTDAESSDT